MSIKDKFIQNTLKEAGQRMLRKQEVEIDYALKLRTGRLLSGRSISVEGGSENKLVFSHPIYERFLDMKNLKNRKSKKRRKIHNRFIYGMYYSVIGNLMYGFTDDVIQTIKKQKDN